MSIKEPIVRTARQQKIYDELMQVMKIKSSAHCDISSAERKALHEYNEARDAFHRLKSIDEKTCITWVRREMNCRYRTEIETSYTDYLTTREYDFNITVLKKSNITRKPFFVTVSGRELSGPWNIFECDEGMKGEQAENANGHPYLSQNSDHVIRRFQTAEEAQQFAHDFKVKLIERYADSILFDYCYIYSRTETEAERDGWKSKVIQSLKIIDDSM
jgi:hypothetical protein